MTITRYEKVLDPRLGRHKDSRAKLLRHAASPRLLTPLVSVAHLRVTPILDQGQVGSCTANAALGALGTDPLWSSRPQSASFYSEATAQSLYSDEEVELGYGPYPPNDQGGSGPAIARVLKKRGLIRKFSHVRTLNSALRWLVKQPIIIGIDWYDTMMQPDVDGRLHPRGNIAGGHEIVLDEIDVENKRVWLTNSWGPNWGVSGRAYLTWDDFSALLKSGGDATIFTV